MSPAVPTRPSFTSAWRGRSPGFNEFNALLNLLDEPTLLIDYHRGVVLGANSSLIQLTAFTHTEITSTSLDDLIPGFSTQILAIGEEKEALLNHHTREPIPVIVRVISLDRSYQWFLLILTPTNIYRQLQAEEQRQELFLGALYDLANLSTQPDLDTALKMALKIGHTLLGASVLQIYQADAHFPQLNRIASWNDGDLQTLPDVLPSINLMRLQSANLWLVGKRVTSELHRAARIANLSYLATVPLGQAGAWSGLLAVGDRETTPPDDILSLLEILAANISAVFQHFILEANLKDTLEGVRKSLSINETTLENAQEGVVFLNPDLTISAMNPSAEDILGYAIQEVAGQTAESILIGSETIATALRSALQGIATHNLGNITLHRRQGQPFPAHVQTIPVLNNDQIISIIVLVSDVSENEQIRVRTLQLEQRAVLGEVTAIFAHEVRNPINNISTGLQLMAIKLSPDDPNQELIGRMEHDCNRLTQLMESVLSFSRPQEYHMEPIDICVFIERIIERWQPRFTRSNVKSFIQKGEEVPSVLGDPRALEQVFTNLISNAVQAMSKDGGTLAFKISKTLSSVDEPMVEVDVSDTGPGIPDDIKEHVFEPFMTTNPKGTGLGLAITQRIIHAHKGTIKVNTFPGGTVFLIYLPAILGETHNDGNDSSS